MQYTNICLFFCKIAILVQSKSYKSLKISILCNLIKVLQLLYLRYLSTITAKVSGYLIKNVPRSECFEL